MKSCRKSDILYVDKAQRLIKSAQDAKLDKQSFRRGGEVKDFLFSDARMH